LPLTQADQTRLRAHVIALAGERHPGSSPLALSAAEDYVEAELAAAGCPVERHEFTFRGLRFHNVVARTTPRVRDAPHVVVGAHFDTVVGTPGADDNASGVAAMLEVARLLAHLELDATLEFVGFNLEEPQGSTYRVGSRAYASAARRRGVQYAGVYVLEMVGYTDNSPGTQSVPLLLFWKRVPRAGTFLAATGDGRSGRLLRAFAKAAGSAVPDLQVVTFRTPLKGWVVPDTRLSDNASFWDEGYPALMLTDTAFLRNPNYHRSTDAVDTLDFEFMAKVVEATAAAVLGTAGLHGVSSSSPGT